MRRKVKSVTHSIKTNWAATADWIACLTVLCAGISMFLAIVCVLLSSTE
jgi:hypothetical protein